MRRNRGRRGDVTRWLTRQAILIPSGLGEKPLQRLLLLYYRMYTHRGTLGNMVVLLISVAGIFSSFVRYQYLNVVNTSRVGAAVYTTVWVTVLFSSCTCSLLYLRLLGSCRNIYGLWIHAIDHMRVPAPGLILAVIVNSVIGAYAVTMLRADMLAIAERVEAMDMHLLWRTIFYVLYYARITQRFLECLFTTLVFPVAKLWADTTPIHIRECTVQLLPWRNFHLFQRCLLFMTLLLSREDYSSSWFHLQWVGVQLYVIFSTVWLSMVALYSCTGAGSVRSLVPKKNVSPSEESGTNRVVSGRSLPKVVYSERSPLVVSGPFQRFQAMIHPERQPRKTEQQSTISEEQTKQEEGSRDTSPPSHDKNEAAEAVPAPWPVDPSALERPVDEEYDRHLVFQEAMEEASPPGSQKSPEQDTPTDPAESDVQQRPDSDQEEQPDERLAVLDDVNPDNTAV